MFEVIVGAVAVIAGIMAGISGAGIGSVLTPLLSFQIDIKLAIAAVAIPHLCGSVMRLLLMWRSVDHRLLLNFGILSAAGGLVGAWIHSFLSNYILTLLFAILLILAGLTGVFGLTERLKFGRWTGWVAGAISGFLGGMVGEQGGFRAAALLGFDVKKDAFIATATAIALMVDVSRTPVYLYTQWDRLGSVWVLITVAAAGVIIGTLFGRQALRWIPEDKFHKVVSGIITALGILMLFRTGG